MKENEHLIDIDKIAKLSSQKELIKLLKSKNNKAKRIIEAIEYETQLEQLQVELIHLQRWVQKHKQRVAILFEGRDAAGKGGAIRRFTEHLSPRAMRVVALPKPNEVEKGQWYFQRYVPQLPNEGQIVFFDRSWYNRAVVEPVNGFCTNEQYERFIRQVPEFEYMIVDAGIILIKFWFSISKEEQKKRLDQRKKNPLKQWKLSAMDETAQTQWDDYTHYKNVMFSKTHTTTNPWIIVSTNIKKAARLESIRYVLSRIPYRNDHKSTVNIIPDPNVVFRYDQHAKWID